MMLSMYPNRASLNASRVMLIAGGALFLGLLSTLLWMPSYELADVVLFGVAMLYFLVLGSLILARVPGNRIGWLFAVISVTIGGSGLLGAIGDLGYVTASTVAGALWLLWIGLLPLLVFWFPTGRPPTPRWRVVGGFLYAVIAATTFTALFTENLCRDGDAGVCNDWIANPIGIKGVPHPEYSDLLGALLIAGLVAAVVSILWRYRISRTTERLQLKWFLLATSLFIASIAAEMIYEALGMFAPTWVSVLNAVGILSIPIAATVAILRYRLFDIDRIISRTVSYALLGGLLAALVGLIATLAGSRFEDPVVVAATTLGAAAIFNPLRLRLQRLVDRRFNRSRYDAERVVNEFTESLTARMEVEAVLAGWTGVVGETMEPAFVTVWMRQPVS